MNFAAAIAALAVILGAGAALLYFQFRHALLAALILVAPFLSVPAWRLLPALTDDQFSYEPFARSFAAIFAVLVGERIVRAVRDGRPARYAVAKALGSVAGTVAPVLVALLLSTLAVAVMPVMWEDCAAAALFALMGCVLVSAAVWLALLFPYSEDFIARANRAGEAREELAARAAGIAQTRWAFSVSGIAIILASIAVFGTRGTGVDANADLPVFIPAAAVLVFLAAAVVTRDWRLSLAFTLSLALFAAWMFAYPKSRVFSVEPVFFSLALATIAAPLSVLASQWSRAMRQGDDLAAALTRALRREGPVVVIAGLYLLTSWLVPAAMGRAVPLSLTVILSMFAEIAIFPALAVTIYTILPRYRGVEEVFGKR